MTSYRGRILKKVIRTSVAHLRKRKRRSMEEYRRRLDQIAKQIPVVPYIKIESVIVQGLYAEWLLPRHASSHHDTAILYLHGGGYTVGSCMTHRALCARIAKRTRVKVLLLEYRLAPEHPFPAALDDAITAYHWLLEQGFSPEKIAFAGDSAGAGLCLSTTLALREQNLTMPYAVACISPWVDLLHRGESHHRNASIDPLLVTTEAMEAALTYTDADNLQNPLVSPIYADLRHLPPVLIQVGEDEILLDDAVTLAHKLQEAKGEVDFKIWPGMWHVWHIAGSFLPEAEQGIEELSDFLVKHRKAST